MKFSALVIVLLMLAAGCTTKIVVIAPPTPVGEPTLTTEQAGYVAAIATQNAAPSPTAAPAPTVAPPPAAPARMIAEDARALAIDYFRALLALDPFHPPGTLSCSTPTFDTASREWASACAFVVPPGQFYPGFSPGSPAVVAGLADPLPIPPGVYLARTVRVDDATGSAR